MVYKGYERARDRFVLLKVLRPAYSRDETVVSRFEDEARLLARVRHPNVVAVYTHGQDPQGLFLAAEFVDGIDLAHLVERGPLPVELAVFILHEAAKGLQAAHEQGVLHRDIKPANLLISHEGQVKLADFGMASLAEPEEAPAEEVRGTLAYLAPEQVLGHPPTPASDLFSLGATFYEMLAGRPAFAGAGASAFFDAVLHHDPMPALETRGLPAPVLACCRRLLARDPADRYDRVAALLRDLEPLRQAHPADAAALAAYLADPEAYRRREPRPVAPPVPAPPRTRRRVLQGAVVAVVLALAGYAGGLWPGAAPTRPAAGPEAPAVTPASDPTEPDSLTFRGAPPEGTTTADRETDRPAGADDRTPDGPDPARVGDEATGREETIGPAVTAGEPPPETEVEDHSDVPPSLRDSPAPPAEATGTLRVVSEPWAVVYVEGDSVGVTPLGVTRPLTLPAGTYRITLRQPDLPAFPSYDTTVEVTPGRTSRIDVSLWQTVGRVMLVVNPWARISVDGIYRDTTPLGQPLIMAPGTHVLTLEHDGLGRLQDTIRVEAGRVDTLRYNLLRPGNHP